MSQSMYTPWTSCVWPEDSPFIQYFFRLRDQKWVLPVWIVAASDVSFM